MSKVFVLTRGGPTGSSRGVIGSTVGAYPRGTGSNRGEWALFPLIPSALSFVFL